MDIKTLTLEEKLSKIQLNLKAPKGQNNDFGHYKYRSCEDILEAVKPLLNGLIITLSDRIVLIGDRYYVKATATIKDSKDSIKVSAYARENLDKKGMDSAQITGATSSYARKYALNGMFAIDDTKDADTMNNTATATTKATVKPQDITQSMYEKYSSVQQEKVRTFFAKKNSLESMNKDEFYQFKCWS